MCNKWQFTDLALTVERFKEEETAFRVPIRAGRTNMGNDAIILLSYHAELPFVEFCEFPDHHYSQWIIFIDFHSSRNDHSVNSVNFTDFFQNRHYRDYFSQMLIIFIKNCIDPQYR